jgi:DNA-binding transcriptional regulator YiaG
MVKSFKLLRDKMSPESQARALKKAQKMLAEIPIQAFQYARSLSQDNMAETLHLNQASIFKMEQRTRYVH